MLPTCAASHFAPFAANGVTTEANSLIPFPPWRSQVVAGLAPTRGSFLTHSGATGGTSSVERVFALRGDLVDVADDRADGGEERDEDGAEEDERQDGDREAASAPAAASGADSRTGQVATHDRRRPDERPQEGKEDRERPEEQADDEEDRENDAGDVGPNSFIRDSSQVPDCPAESRVRVRRHDQNRGIAAIRTDSSRRGRGVPRLRPAWLTPVRRTGGYRSSVEPGASRPYDPVPDDSRARRCVRPLPEPGPDPRPSPLRRDL